jgi:hypothetical protein
MTGDAPRRITRIRRPTEKVRLLRPDVFPEGPGPLEEVPPAPAMPPVAATSLTRPLLLRIPELVRTMVNSFGLTRLYFGRPTGVPDLELVLENYVADHVGDPDPLLEKSISDIIFPYPNIHAFNLNKWYWTKGTKSKEDRRDLIENVIGAPGFKPKKVVDVDFEKLDEQVSKGLGSRLDGSGWENSSIVIEVPMGQKATKKSKQKQAAAHQSALLHDEVDTEADGRQTKKFTVHNFHHRKLTHVMRAAIEDIPQAKDYHWHPYESTWQPPWPGASPERVYDELYTSSSFLKADRELQNSPQEPGCTLPRAVCAIMLWSDATHVAQFGTAKLWPIYAYIGNLSKYTRCRPTARAAHHIAYLSGVYFDMFYLLR